MKSSSISVRTAPSVRVGLTKTEAKVLDALETLGYYDLVHNGIPDFIINVNGKPVFIEVKSSADLVRPNQYAAHDFLRKLGFTVEIVNGSEHRLKVMSRLRSIFSQATSQVEE